MNRDFFDFVNHLKVNVLKSINLSPSSFTGNYRNRKTFLTSLFRQVNLKLRFKKNWEDPERVRNRHKK